MPTDLDNESKIWILWLIFRSPNTNKEAISLSLPSHVPSSSLLAALEQFRTDGIILQSEDSISLTVAGLMLVREQGMQDLSLLEEKAQLLYDTTANYIYEDLNNEVPQLLEQLSSKGMGRSSVFIREACNLVSARLSRLSDAYKATFVKTLKETRHGITPFRKYWLERNLERTWENELARARQMASAYAQSSGLSAADVNAGTERVVITGRQQTLKQLLNSIRIATLDSKEKYDLSMSNHSNMLKFAENTYLTRSDTARQAHRDRWADTFGTMSPSNVRVSGASVAELEAQLIAELTSARKDSTLEALKRFGLPLDAELASSLKKEIGSLAETHVAGMSSRLRHDAELTVKRTGTSAEPLKAKMEEIGRDVRRRVTPVLNAIYRDIDNEQLLPQQSRPASADSHHTTNIYNLHGPHSRVNIESTDQSVNISNVTPEELFAALRQALESGVRAEHDRQVLIEGLSKLQAATESNTFAAAYQKFIASAADHMTIILPFLPALTTLLTSHHG